MKKRVLCMLLTVTLCLAQVLPIFAEELSEGGEAVEVMPDDVEEISKAEAGELPAADTADAETETEDMTSQTEDEVTPETAAEKMMLVVPTCIEEGVECAMTLTVTPSTVYNIRLVNKATGQIPILEQHTSTASSGNVISTTFTIGKDKLEIGDYLVQSWVGSIAYEAAQSAGIITEDNLSVRKSLLAEHNKNMSEIKVESAVYEGKGKEVFPTITIVETANGTEYTLVRDVDFKLTVTSDNKAKMGAAKVKVEGIGNYAGEKEVDFDIAPPKPVFTKAVSVSVSNVNLEWTNSVGANGYTIDRKEEKGEYKNIANVAGGDTVTYADKSTELSVGATYTYRICAYAASEIDPAKTASSAQSEITVKVIPSTPKIDSLSSVSTKKQKLTWKKTEDADGYTVYKVEKGKETKVKDVKSAAKESCQIGKLSTGYKYTYYIKAFKKDAQGNKVYSEPSETLGAKVTVGTPVLISVTSVKATENLIKWKKTNNAYGYYVFRRESANAKFKKIGTVNGGTVTSYHDTKAQTGKNYIYTVKAYTKAKVKGVNKTLVGDYDAKGISGKAIPAKTVFTLQQNNKGVLITIANAEGATGYYIYRKKDGEKWEKHAVPAQAGDMTVYLEKTLTPNTSYQFYVVPYTESGTQKTMGVKSDTIKFQTK